MPSFTVFKGAKDGNPRQGTTSKPDTLLGDNVLLKVTASGVCGTDLHYRTQDIVLGHEGVGIVEEVGPDVKFLRKGDRVGWGYEVDSCGRCLDCLEGEEIYCANRSIYGVSNLDQGSFSSHAIWREAFLHPIPEGMSDRDAAPLQCGGATVFTALYDAKPNEAVGIIGVGGLGHLAIQFAAKMGCRVVVLSGSSSKKEQATRLGAHEFISMKENNGAGSPTPLSRLLVTTASQPDWDSILPMMAPRSRIYPLTVSSNKLEIPSLPLIQTGISIVGSMVASRASHRKMLQFAALHGIRPVVETFPMTENGIREAMDKLEEGKVQYRAVLLPE